MFIQQLRHTGTISAGRITRAKTQANSNLSTPTETKRGNDEIVVLQSLYQQ